MIINLGRMRAIPREVDDAYVRDAAHAYALGLWCADGYWWSSSIGLSNVEPDLITRFGNYLLEMFPRDRLRVRIYQVEGCEPDESVLSLTDRVSIRPPVKMKRTAYHVYVNSRPLVRRFFSDRDRVSEMPATYIGPYIAGRFDGDGTFGDTPRIAYTTRSEATVDASLMESVGLKTSVLYYAKANEYCIYIHKVSWKDLEQLLRGHSWKIDRRFTL